MKTWFLKKWLKWRVTWSNFKNRGEVVDTPVAETIDLQYSDLVNIIKLTKKVYSKFKWTMDKPAELFDRMRTPATCYIDYSEDDQLLDDCDGFHACLLHILKSWGWDGALLTYMTRNVNKCHTILIAKKDDDYYKIDYTSVKCFDSIEEIVEDIKSKHNDFIDYNLVKFNTKYFIVNNF